MESTTSVSERPVSILPLASSEYSPLQTSATYSARLRLSGSRTWTNTRLFERFRLVRCT